MLKNSTTYSFFGFFFFLVWAGGISEGYPEGKSGFVIGILGVPGGLRADGSLRLFGYGVSGSDIIATIKNTGLRLSISLRGYKMQHLRF
jgi:hypothetical protein